MRPTVLIHPPTRQSLSLAASLAGAEHLGLGYVAAALEAQGFPSRVLNYEGEPASPSDAVQEVLQFDPLWTGVSPTSLSMPWTREFVQEFRRLSNTAIVCGGHLASLMGEDFLREVPEATAVVVGEGEVAAVDLSRYFSGDGTRLADIAGLATRSGTVTTLTSSRARPITRGLESLWPRRRPEEMVRSARIVTSVGCAHRCTFCTTPPFYQGSVHLRDVGDVVAEMQSLHAEFGIVEFYVNDDTFLDTSERSRERTETLLTRMSNSIPGATVRVLARSDGIVRWAEALRRWRSLGLRSVFVGVESGSDEVLSGFNKGAQAAIHREAARLLGEAGIALTAGFMMFSPQSGSASLRQSLRFLQEIGQLYRTTLLCRCVLGFPGTPLYQSWRATGDIDAERSDAFVLYPKFRVPWVRSLSIGMARVETECADTDGKGLQIHGALRCLTVSARDPSQLTAVLGDAEASYYRAFSECIDGAEAGCTDAEVCNTFLSVTAGARERVRDAVVEEQIG